MPGIRTLRRVKADLQAVLGWPEAAKGGTTTPRAAGGPGPEVPSPHHAQVPTPFPTGGPSVTQRGGWGRQGSAHHLLEVPLFSGNERPFQKLGLRELNI